MSMLGRTTRRTAVLLAVALLTATLLATASGDRASAESNPNGGDVVGGQPTTIEQHPHQVLLFVEYYRDGARYPYCGGSIISPQVVMTAAHCLSDGLERPFSTAELWVLAGSSDARFGTLRAVDAVSRHPRFDATALVDDLAYLHLRTPLPAALEPIATAVPGDEVLYPEATLATVSGWGATDPGGTVYPNVLREGTVPIVADAPCEEGYAEEGYGPDAIDEATQVCAGGGGVDSCFGDSGGPLSVDDGGTPLLVGVVSWGPETCANPIAPGVYTEVAAFADMTEAHLAAPVFTDVRFGHPFLTEVFHLREAGVLTGFADGSYRPGAVVTRQAMSAFLHRLVGEPPFADPEVATFGDVPLTHPFFAEIEWMAAAGISTGYPGGTYRPSAPVTRGAMSAFLYRLARGDDPYPGGSPSFDDVGPGHPFFDQIEWLGDEGIANGFSDDTFRPAVPVTRQSMAAFLYRLLPLLP